MASLYLRYSRYVAAISAIQAVFRVASSGSISSASPRPRRTAGDGGNWRLSVCQAQFPPVLAKSEISYWPAWSNFPLVSCQPASRARVSSLGLQRLAISA